MLKRLQIEVRGCVQGVGFRPTVFRHATSLGLAGHVANTAIGVAIEVEGDEAALARFQTLLRTEPPPRARIDEIQTCEMPPLGESSFSIAVSRRSGDIAFGMPADLATCADCRRELFDPANRRFHHPFLNCTNCGPRFTIIRSLPYDRAATTMSGFAMCPDCRREYADPRDRRFDAQPTACPACGPQLRLLSRGWRPPPSWPPEGAIGTVAVNCRVAEGAGETGASGLATPNPPADSATLEIKHNPYQWHSQEGHGEAGTAAAPLAEAVRRLRAGEIGAIKGLGGFHLACLPEDAPVQRLRERKQRPHQPFAVMFRDLAELRQHCVTTPEEEAALASPAAPVVLLKRRVPLPQPAATVTPAHRHTATLSPLLAPDTGELGAFLAYTPLHHLLLAEIPALVMTSANHTDEPIAISAGMLGGLADFALDHDREILRRCDDSVLKFHQGLPLFLRRSRGYVPDPVRLPVTGPSVLACGADLKNSFCITRSQQAFLSQHIGNLEDFPAQEFFNTAAADLARLLEVRPLVIAHDLHPDYHSTRQAQAIAKAAGVRTEAIQHHHAHIAAVMAEHGLNGPVIGVALDGTGYGTDGTIWGGEFLVAELATFQRVAHFKPFPLPGGEAAIHEPARTALGWLVAEFGEAEALALAAEFLPALPAVERRLLAQLAAKGGPFAPLTSSAGRLFDAAAALLGFTDPVTYEGQAAIRLQALAEKRWKTVGGGRWTVDGGGRGQRTEGKGRRSEVGSLGTEKNTPNIEHQMPTAAHCPLFTIHRPPSTVHRPPSTVHSLSFAPLLRQLLDGLRNGTERAELALAFHLAIADAVTETCRQIRDNGAEETRESETRDQQRAAPALPVALSGGVFQNTLLLELLVPRLEAAGFAVFTHRQVPPNDACIALGQAAVALARTGPGKPQ